MLSTFGRMREVTLLSPTGKKRLGYSGANVIVDGIVDDTGLAHGFVSRDDPTGMLCDYCKMSSLAPAHKAYDESLVQDDQLF